MREASRTGQWPTTADYDQVVQYTRCSWRRDAHHGRAVEWFPGSMRRAADWLAVALSQADDGSYVSVNPAGEVISLTDLGKPYDVLNLPGAEAIRSTDGEFVQCTVNCNRPTPYHPDSEWAGTSVLLCACLGSVSSRLVFPDLRVALVLGHGDVVRFDSRLVHGNTPIEGTGRRFSLVEVFRT